MVVFTDVVAHMYVAIAVALAVSDLVVAAASALGDVDVVAPHVAAASDAGVVDVDAVDGVAADVGGRYSAQPFLLHYHCGILVSLWGPAVSPALRA